MVDHKIGVGEWTPEMCLDCIESGEFSRLPMGKRSIVASRAVRKYGLDAVKGLGLPKDFYIDEVCKNPTQIKNYCREVKKCQMVALECEPSLFLFFINPDEEVLETAIIKKPDNIYYIVTRNIIKHFFSSSADVLD